MPEALPDPRPPPSVSAAWTPRPRETGPGLTRGLLATAGPGRTDTRRPLPRRRGGAGAAAEQDGHPTPARAEPRPDFCVTLQGDLGVFTFCSDGRKHVRFITGLQCFARKPDPPVSLFLFSPPPSRRPPFFFFLFQEIFKWAPMKGPRLGVLSPRKWRFHLPGRAAGWEPQAGGEVGLLTTGCLGPEFLGQGFANLRCRCRP